MAPSRPTDSAHEITRRSGSNLAFALWALPRERREDMTVFYAFCRVVDDIVDQSGLDDSVKRQHLTRWRYVLTEGAVPDPSPLEQGVRAVRDKYGVPPRLFHAILDGMEMDIDVLRYASFSELQKYCYRVASAVGLVSIEIFGYRDEGCRDYAEQLGYALQLTNILRDVGQDAREDGRIYLPQEDLRRFRVGEDEILGGGQPSPELRDLLEFEGERAESFYRRAARLLPASERGSMIAAETMRSLYYRLLQRIREGGYRVLDRRYRLGRAEKVCLLTKSLLLGIKVRH